MSEDKIIVQRVIKAPAQAIFDLIADPAMHPVLDGGGTVKASRDDNPKRLSLGAKFGMRMRIGAPYKIENEVVEFDEPRRIAWMHFARNVWRYELEPVDGETLVTETFDYSSGRLGWFVKLAGFRRRNHKGMAATLERIAARVEP